MQLSFNCSCIAGSNILLTNIQMPQFNLYDFSWSNDVCANHVLCLTKQRSLYKPSLSLSPPQNVLEQPKKYMFHNGSSFHATFFSVNLILFLFVLRLWRSQWASFGRKSRVRELLCCSSCYCYEDSAPFMPLRKAATEGVCLPSTLYHWDSCIRIMVMVV